MSGKHVTAVVQMLILTKLEQAATDPKRTFDSSESFPEESGVAAVSAVANTESVYRLQVVAMQDTKLFFVAQTVEFGF